MTNPADLPKDVLNDGGEAKFVALASGLKVPNQFLNYLILKNLADAESMALLAAREEDLKVDIFDVLSAEGVPVTDIGEKMAIKKLWVACKKPMKEGGPSSSSVVAPVEPVGLDPVIEGDVKKIWFSTHGFVLPDAWLLQPEAQKQLWKDVQLEYPRVQVILLARLRLASSTSTARGTTVAFAPGQLPQATSDIADMVHGGVEVFTRIRAFLYTLSYVSIRKPGFLPLQAAIFGSEKIFALCLGNSGRPPPVSFLCEAWASTILSWSEHVRVTGEPLKNCIMSTGAWEHKWKFQAAAGSAAPDTDLPPELLGEVKRLRLECSHQQSQNDQLRRQLRNAGNGGNDNRDRGVKNGGNDNRDRGKRMERGAKDQGGKGGKPDKNRHQQQRGGGLDRDRSPRKR